MSGRNRLAVSICVGSAVLATAAAGALGYTGTHKGRRLARELLSSYNHTRFLAGSLHGSVYYCPSWIAGYVAEVISPDAPAQCRKHPATASWVETLSHGTGVSAVGTVTAKHRPTITFVAKPHATFIKAKGAHCWTNQKFNGASEPDGDFVGSQPFGFWPKAYMSVGPKHGNRIKLVGRWSGFGGFAETDTLNATTHQMIGESIFFQRRHPAKTIHLISSYHTTHSAPTVPRTTPVC